MSQLLKIIRKTGSDRGATAVEYSILAAAIAAVIVTIVVTTGVEVEGLFEAGLNAVTTANS